jgi:hypothetical protein
MAHVRWCSDTRDRSADVIAARVGAIELATAPRPRRRLRAPRARSCVNPGTTRAHGEHAGARATVGGTVPVPAATIDDVIARLDAIIRDCIAAESRLGYFAALYNRVTRRVRDGIARGEFADGPRMARLDVVFANRYLDAFDRDQAGEPPSRAWRLAFETARHDDAPPLVHLLLGMNAHIGLDLGVAAARTCPGAALPGLAADFTHINAVLASLVATVEDENIALEPLLATPVHAARGLINAAIGRIMDTARARAWDFATELAPLPLAAQTARLAHRDDETTAIGRALVDTDVMLRWLKIGERGTIADQIRVFAADPDPLPPR